MLNCIKVTDCSNIYINGLYNVLKDNDPILKNIYINKKYDKSYPIYYKNNNFQIYRYNGVWRVGSIGKIVYYVLKKCVNSSWTYSNLNLNNLTFFKKINKKLQNNYEDEDEYINICFCSDINLINYIPTVINSIQKKNNNNKIKIHYIHNITNTNKIINLKNYIESFKNLSFMSYYKTWDYNYSGIIHISDATMLRLFIPELINERKVLYLDIDLIVNIDLKKIYYIKCNYTGIGLKNSIIYSELKNKQSGNCGVTLMDLEKLRKNKFTEVCLSIHKKNSNRHDQFIINKYCNGNHTLLNSKYNIYVNQDLYLVKHNTDFILHYAGKIKPYNNNNCIYKKLWDENFIKINF